MAMQFNPLRRHSLCYCSQLDTYYRMSLLLLGSVTHFLYLFRKFIIYTITLILFMLNLTLITSNFTCSKCFVTVYSLTVVHTEFVGTFAVYILKPKAGH